MRDRDLCAFRPAPLKWACRAALTLCLTAFSSTLSFGQIMPADIPLPEKIDIIPDETSAFSGIWAGEWTGGMRVLLAVEQITEGNRARVVYAINGRAIANIPPQWARHDAVIIGDTLRLSGTDAPKIAFTLSPTGRLRAVYEGDQGFGILTRQDDLENLNWSGGTRFMIETDLIEDAGIVHLDVTTFAPPRDGPFPLAIVNHGSTGRGTQADRFASNWADGRLADVLNAQGYIVAFPMRRGRGKSDGLYDEGFGDDRSKGYTCNAEQSLEGAERAAEDVRAVIKSLQAQPHITDDPVLLSGVSRGGALSLKLAAEGDIPTRGVINFVGGWISDKCPTATRINTAVMTAKSDVPSIWIYGNEDAFYAITHAQKIFEKYKANGGDGTFSAYDLPGSGNGHWVHAFPNLWEQSVTNFLTDLSK